MAEMNWNFRELKREDYLDIAFRNHLSPMRAEQYAQLMIRRFPKESDPRYATEWAQRFAKEEAYCKGDQATRAALWEVGYYPMDKTSYDFEVASHDDKRWVDISTQHERNVNTLITLLRFMPEKYIEEVMLDFNLERIDNVDSLRETLMSRNPQEVYIALKAIEEIHAKSPSFDAIRKPILLDRLNLAKPVKVSEHARRTKKGATRVRRHSREKAGI
jgi:hypothetical protein